MLGNSSSFTGCQRRCSQSPICVLFHLAITLFHSFWVMSCTNMHLRVAGHITMHLLAPVILLVTPVSFLSPWQKSEYRAAGKDDPAAETNDSSYAALWLADTRLLVVSAAGGRVQVSTERTYRKLLLGPGKATTFDILLELSGSCSR